MKMKRIMGFFLALVMFIGCLPLNTIETHAAEGDVAIDEAHFPNENFRNYVSREFDINKDGKLSRDELDKVEEIKIANTSLVYSLKGIEYFKNLIKLIFYGNYLTELDVSKNINLTTLHCYGNRLTSLDVTKNTKLTELNCCCNNLKSLDVTKNTKLTELYCSDNNLKSLDVTKNTKLATLYCNNNNLKSLDVSKNKNLTVLHCEYNKLTSLDLSKNTNLTYLDCHRNELTSLNVSKNTKLNYLDCNVNNLTSLDVTKNTNLTYLDCFNNKLTSLDVTKNTKLTDLECRFQQYNITVIKGIREFKYSKFPGQFKKDKVISPVGASFGDDALTVDNDTIKEVTYKYKVKDNEEMNVILAITYKVFDPKHVESMKVKEQPKLVYTEGEKLDLSGLVVTLKDNQDLEKDVAFKDFETYKITTNPKNGADLTLADNDQPVTISKGSLQDDTKNLTVNEKVFDPEHVESMVVKEQPKLIYTEGEKLDLSGLVVTLTDKQGLTKDVAFKNFEANGIKTNPKNGADLTLADDNKPVTISKGSLQDETKNLTVNAKVFDQKHIEKMVVKTQPKLIYTEGEKLDLSGLVVTLKDNQGLEKDVAFKDFETYKITTNPKNGTDLTSEDNGKKVSLTKENSTEETEALTKDVAFRAFASNVITTNLIDDTALTLANNGKALKLTNGLLTAQKNTLTAQTEALTVNKKETPPPTPTPDPPVVGPVDPTPNDPPVVGPVDPTPNDPPVVGPVDPTPNDPPVVGPVDPTPNDPPVVGPVDPTQPGEKPQVANNGKLPKTANNMNIELYNFLMILSAGLLVVAFKRKKRVNR
ncbi:bacterial Ig-like domain-containing protein [Parvimonas parva]|uniref:leucine-rich repeat domain-containing protein n=3 Tax=Parvimonas TaxID=543311 RepID=UPI0038B2B6E2